MSQNQIVTKSSIACSLVGETKQADDEERLAGECKVLLYTCQFYLDGSETRKVVFLWITQVFQEIYMTSDNAEDLFEIFRVHTYIKSRPLVNTPFLQQLFRVTHIITQFSHFSVRLHVRWMISYMYWNNQLMQMVSAELGKGANNPSTSRSIHLSCCHHFLLFSSPHLLIWAMVKL